MECLVCRNKLFYLEETEFGIKLLKCVKCKSVNRIHQSDYLDEKLFKSFLRRRTKCGQ